jgi:hypothetical protein
VLARFWLAPTARFGRIAPVARRAHSSWVSGKCLERGCDRARQRAGFAACSVGLAAFGGLSGRRGGDLVLVELEEVVGRCC